MGELTQSQKRTVKKKQRSRSDSKSTDTRNASLDGLRALAILSVIAYHFSASWLPSGHLGVVMFFVLSGYFFSYSLIKEFYRSSTISYRKRFVKRFIRIWPAMMAMIVATLCACTFFNHLLLTKMRPDLLPASTFTLNLAYIINNLSYFDAIGAPSPLTHLWYLGVDAQFAFIWPLVFLLLMSRKDTFQKSLTFTRRATFVLAVLSAVGMGVVFWIDKNPTRVYYDMATRAFSLLAGVWLACIWPLTASQKDGRLPIWRHFPVLKFVSARVMGVVGIVSLAALICGMVVFEDTSLFFYYGGMALASALMVLAMAGAMTHGSILSRALSVKPLDYLGKRSFSLYLWHYPVILLFSANLATATIAIKLLCLAVIGVVSELSYRFIEVPCTKGAALVALRKAKQQKTNPVSFVRAHLVSTLAGVVILGVALTGVFFIPDETYVPENVLGSTGDAVDKGQDVAAKKEVQTDAEALAQSASVKQDINNLPQGEVYLVEDSLRQKQGIVDPLMIGDSVPGETGTVQAFKSYCPDGILDSFVGRRSDQMLAVLKDYLNKGVVGNVVVLEAFSNNSCKEAEIKEMIDLLGKDRSIFLVTPHIPDKFGPDNINKITSIASQYDNVSIIDWANYGASHPEWFYKDQTHLKPSGQKPYLAMIIDAIKKPFAQYGGWVFTPEQYKEYQQCQADKQKTVEDATYPNRFQRIDVIS